MSDADFKQIQKLQQERNAAAAAKNGKVLDNAVANRANKVSMTENMDTELYGSNNDRFAGYNTSIAVNDDDDEMNDDDGNHGRLVGQYTAGKDIINEIAASGGDDINMMESKEQQAQIQSRQTDYQRRQQDRGPLTPTRADPFAANSQAGAAEGHSYREVMAQRELEREEQRVAKLIAEKKARGEISAEEHEEHEATLKRDDLSSGDDKENKDAGSTTNVTRKRKNRWDATTPAEAEKEDTEKPVVKPAKRSRWDAAADPSAQTEQATTNGTAATAPEKKTGRSRWDKVGVASGQPDAAAPGAPNGVPNGEAFSGSLTDEEIDFLLPSEGYEILIPPEPYSYAPPRRAGAVAAAPTGFMNQESATLKSLGKQIPSEIPGVGDLAFFKAEDMAYFGKLMETTNEDEMSVEDLKERKIMRLLLKVKNGTPPMRKTALRQITDNARSFGPGPLFNQILPLLMEKSLEDQERHLLVKVIDRILYKLDDLVRPYTHKILVVIEPLLIDSDYYARVEGREIISNLAKAAGLAHMISTMRPDIDHVDEYVRNTTARAFSVVALALGIPSLLPFLRAVCRSRKSWEARHTGVKIIQQIAILMGSGILPHLKGLVDCLAPALQDEQVRVRTVCSQAIAALAEAANPYGIESFDEILNPLWTGARKQRGKGLAGYLKAVGFIIPLMDEEYANYYTSQIMEIVIREFASPDEDMKRTVLKVISQCSSTQGVSSTYLRENVLTPYFRAFWVRRIALDKRMARCVIDTTFDLSQKAGAGTIIQEIVNHLKDENELFRKMAVETIDKVVTSLGTADVDQRLQDRLVDGILTAFQSQNTEDIVFLNGAGTVFQSLSVRCKDYLPQICSAALFRLNDKAPATRSQAAELIARLAPVMRVCDEDGLLSKMNSVLYEYLGEEYPEVLASILNALRAIVTVVGIETLNPPVRDLLPRLTPILRNRAERVQENVVDLVGRIADRGPESVHAREWMRICFELLDMLKANKKGIRRAANNTFGYIAKAIGPSDVLATLLNNLRVQERQSRVCTAVAIGIVAETCAPFTVIPALMNEYRVPELNVRNGILKAFSFLCEYVSEMTKDYVYAITPLLEDALVDRDQVHRQTAASVVKHIALGVVGLGCEDAMLHLLNLLVPNIYETSPHVIDRVIEAIDGIAMCVGAGQMMNYFIAGLFHPARKVRTPYWRLHNDLYVRNSDAMVPYYPAICQDELSIVL